MQDGAALKLFMARVQDTVDRGLAQGGEVADWAGQLSAAINDIAVLTAELWGSGQFDVVLANASAYLERVRTHRVGVDLAGAGRSCRGNPWRLLPRQAASG